jgi:hypothetical protein
VDEKRVIGKVRQGVISLCSLNAGSLRLGNPNGTRIPIKRAGARIPQPEPESQRAKVAIACCPSEKIFAGIF